MIRNKHNIHKSHLKRKYIHWFWLSRLFQLLFHLKTLGAEGNKKPVWKQLQNLIPRLYRSLDRKSKDEEEEEERKKHTDPMHEKKSSEINRGEHNKYGMDIIKN